MSGPTIEKKVSNDDDVVAAYPHDKCEVVVKETNVASVTLAAALEAQKPNLLSRNMIKLYGILCIGYLVSTMNGYDSSLMSGINASPAFQSTFNLTGAGSSSGIVFIVYNIGSIIAWPFCSLFADGYGRRVCIFIGCLVVVVGTAIQVTSHTIPQFIGGRLVLGFGAAIASAAGPTYIVELAHPAYRGPMAGAFNTCWWLGSIISGWTTYGANLHIQGSWAWRTPTLVQAGMPSIVMAFILFFPESPRWLVAHGRDEEAIAVMAEYHGDGDKTAPIVQLQYQEIVSDLKRDANDNRWWDYRDLVGTRASRYRLGLVIAMAFFGQWSGNNVVSYYLPEMISNAGIANKNTQLLINAINPIFCMLAAIYGASLLDKLGRRSMLLWGLVGALFSYVLLTAFTASSAAHPNLAYGTIVSIYLFGIAFSWGWTPLQTLYSVEVLENRTRAKGSGLNFLFLNIAMMVNTYGISVGIAAIGWKLYVVYIVWIVVEMLCIYFFFVETAGKTLEQLSEVFESKNPVKASLRKTKVAVRADGAVDVQGE